PSSETPRIAIAIFDELMATGIDKCVANMVTGSSSLISDTLFADKRVKKISFTASTQIGKTLMSKAYDHVKRISLERGRHAPAIVDRKFENSAKMCNGINVILVNKDVK